LAYSFFFSYSRTDGGPYLNAFFRDLRGAVAKLKGVMPDGVGFLDQKSIELGTVWDEELIRGLQASRTMVCLYSPAYFSSPYCGKEWNLFYTRCRRFSTKRSEPDTPDLPILPVIWIPPVHASRSSDARKGPVLPDDVDDIVRRVQYTLGDPTDLANLEGLDWIIGRKAKYRILYKDYVDGVARRIVELEQRWSLDTFIDHELVELRDASQAFPHARRSAGASAVLEPQPGHRRPGTAEVVPSPSHGPDIRVSAQAKRVGLVFAAVHPSQVASASRSSTPYGDVGGEDWQPFHPADQAPIGPFAQSVVSGTDLRLTSEVLPFDPGVVRRVRSAAKAQRVVVMIVDPWSLGTVAECRAIFEELDGASLVNMAVLVPRNEADPELLGLWAGFDDLIGSVFPNRRRVWQKAWLRDDLRTPDQLRRAIQETIEILRAELRARAKVTRPLPQAGPAAPPVVHATGTSGT
jgi:FxsC-like protein